MGGGGRLRRPPPFSGFPYEACWRPRQGKARQLARQDQLSRAKAKRARQPSQIEQVCEQMIKDMSGSTFSTKTNTFFRSRDPSTEHRAAVLSILTWLLPRHLSRRPLSCPKEFLHFGGTWGGSDGEHSKWARFPTNFTHLGKNKCVSKPSLQICWARAWRLVTIGDQKASS